MCQIAAHVSSWSKDAGWGMSICHLLHGKGPELVSLMLLSGCLRISFRWAAGTLANDKL